MVSYNCRPRKIHILVPPNPYSKNLPPTAVEGRLRKFTRSPIYGDGAGEVFVLIVVFVSVFVGAAGDSFTIVVLVSFFSAGGLVTVVSFCSQAVSSAAPISMQM